MKDVVVLLINHRFGTRIDVYATFAGAKRGVHAYVASQWSYELGDEPMPENEQDAVDRYFQFVGEDEFYSINVRTVNEG